MFYWVEGEIVAVKGPMVVFNTGTSIFQVVASKLRRTRDIVDLEELPDSCERTGALVLWLSCEGQIDVWELLSDTSYLGAILGRQGLTVAFQVDMRTKKAESFSPQALQGFWSKMKTKNPKVVVMSPTVFTENTNQKEVIWQQYHQCLAMAEYQIFSGKDVHIFGARIRKMWCLRKDLSRSTIANGPSFEASNSSGFSITLAISYNY